MTYKKKEKILSYVIPVLALIIATISILIINAKYGTEHSFEIFALILGYSWLIPTFFMIKFLSPKVRREEEENYNRHIQEMVNLIEKYQQEIHDTKMKILVVKQLEKIDALLKANPYWLDSKTCLMISDQLTGFSQILERITDSEYRQEMQSVIKSIWHILKRDRI